MVDCCLIKKVATVEVYENKNEVRAYGFMAGDRNTPVMEVRFKHLWGESNLSSCKLRWIIVDDVGSLLVGEVPIQSDNTALINLPNELFTGDRRMKVQLTVASCDGERILNLQQFTDLKVINSLASNEVVEPVYQILINAIYDESQKYLKELETSYTQKYGSLDNLYKSARASLEEYLITAENGGNAEFLQGYSPAHFQKVENTINDLIASTKYNVGDVVEVLGYYEKGDGAGHPRIKKPIGYNGADAVIGADGSIWGIVHSGEVNISWFGAKGDGTTDDTIAIQKAFNYATPVLVSEWQNYKNIKILLNGVFFISSSISAPEYTNVDCNGYKCILIISDNSSFNLKKNSTLKNIYIKGGYNSLVLDGYNICLENIYIDSSRNNGVYSENCFMSNFKNVRISNSVNGFNFSKYHTSLTFETCYCLANAGINYILGGENAISEGITYSSLIGCGADGGSVGYLFRNSNSLNVINCGTEHSINASFKTFGKTGINFESVSSHALYDVGSVAFDFSESLDVKDNSLFSYANISNFEYIGLSNETDTPLIKGNEKVNLNIKGFKKGVKKYISTNSQNISLNNNRKIFIKCVFEEGHNAINFCKIDRAITTPETANNSIKKGIININISNYSSCGNDVLNNDNCNLIYAFSNEGNKTSLLHNSETLDTEAKNNMELFVGSTGELILKRKFTNAKTVYINAELTFTELEFFMNYIPISYYDPNYSKTNIESLDTPYHATQMSKLGILDSYHNYLSELHEYEKSQNVQSDSEIMNLNILQPPVIPTEVEAYAKEYNLI